MSVNGLFRAARTLALALSLTLAFAAFPAQAQTPAQEKTITLQVTDTPVSTVMKQIESQSGYTFFYNTKDIPLSLNVTLSVSNENIRTTLDKLFQGTNVTYSIDDKSIILSTRQKAQTPKSHELVGRILDKKGQPVIGATVMISGSMQGTTSGIDGTFSFPYTDALAQSTLDISFIGYRSLSIPVNNRTMLDITLEEDDQQIEAVVVTALGIKRSERAVSYNVQNLTDDVFKTRDANMVNSLSGRIAGVTVNASAAGVGGETKVVMRGSKSISGNNNALYVLDGIPLPSLSLTNPGDSFTIMRESNLTGDGISNFNPDDIASMSALTGPSAAALYGSQAANGVLMLTTRTGEKGLSVNYSNNTTFMSPFVTPAFQNTYGAKDGYYASWGSKLSKPSSWNPVDFFQTGYNTSNSLSVSFGGERSQTYISAGVVTAEGIIPNNEYNRYNFTANHSSSFLKDRMHLSVLGMYMNVNEQNMLSSGQYYNPMIPVYLMSPSDDINKYAVYERYDASRNFPVQYWPWGSQSLQMQNPYWITNRNKVVKMLDSYRLSNGTVISQDSMVMGGTSGVKMVLREGGQIGDIYVNTLKTDEHGMIWVSPTGSTVAPDKDNWIYAGNSNPSYTLSWRNEFRWKGLSLAFMFNARVGGVGVSLTQATMDYFGVSERTAIDRDNGGALVNGQRIPAESFYQTIGGNGADAIGSMYVYSMTNVRLGELTLGYDIPVQKWCKWIKKLNVSFVGRNLWMLYCKAPFDPESVAGTGTYSSGIDYFMQPSTRNLGFSVKVTF